MRVKLDYFRPSGEWYASGSFETPLERAWEIHDLVAVVARERRLPGLCADHADYIVSVSAPEAPDDYPHLYVPPSLTAAGGRR